MKRRSETWKLSAFVLLVAPTVAAAAIDPTAVDKTTASFRALEWWASLMPGTGNFHAYLGLAAFVLLVHVLQLPLVLKYRAMPRGKSRAWMVLALLFTEFVPLVWAVFNGSAWAVAFDADKRGAPLGMIAAVFVPVLTLCLVIGLGSIFGDQTETGRSAQILCQTYMLGPLLSLYPLWGLHSQGWISDVGGEVGAFMWMFGVLPLFAYVRIISDRSRHDGPA